MLVQVFSLVVEDYLDACMRGGVEECGQLVVTSLRCVSRPTQRFMYQRQSHAQCARSPATDRCSFVIRGLSISLLNAFNPDSPTRHRHNRIECCNNCQTDLAQFQPCIFEQVKGDITTKFDVVTHIGRGLVFRWSATLPPQDGGAPVLPSFGGSLVFIRTPFVAELPNLTWYHIWGEAKRTARGFC